MDAPLVHKKNYCRVLPNNIYFGLKDFLAIPMINDLHNARGKCSCIQHF